MCLKMQLLQCFFQLIDKALGLRLSAEEEELGSDFVEHGIGEEPELRRVNSDLEKV